MGSLNKVILFGTLTHDPEPRALKNGAAVCTFGMVLKHRYRSGEETKEAVTFVDVTVYGRTADAMVQYMRKGSSVLVEGRLHLDQWDTKDNPPQKRSKLVVIGENVKFTGRPDAAPTHDEKDNLRW